MPLSLAQHLRSTNTAAPATALTMPNLRQLPGGNAGPAVSVELKPKAGCLVEDFGVHPQRRFKHSTPRYPLHQALKVKQVRHMVRG